MNVQSNASPEHLLSQIGWVRSLARRLVSDESVAEDLTQEVCVRALEHPPSRVASTADSQVLGFLECGSALAQFAGNIDNTSFIGYRVRCVQVHQCFPAGCAQASLFPEFAFGRF